MEAPPPTAEPEAERVAGGPEGGGGGLHYTCLARAGELEARLAAAEAALSEQGGRLAAAATTEGELRASLTAAEAAASELRDVNEALSRGACSLEREHAAEAREHADVLASFRELQAALSALGPGVSIGAVEAALRTARFLERRRDFGAELPAGVLLNIMDRAPDCKCVVVEIML